MKIDKTLIPNGPYCYEHTDQLGRVLCPYFKFTDYGMIKCEYLNREVIVGGGYKDDRGNKVIALHYYGSEEEYNKHNDEDSFLWDGVKECSVNEL